MACIVAAHDLSGVGRCSLVSVISVLSAMGHQPTPLPTALLSMQTAFPGYSYLDFTPYIQDYLQGWERLGLHPDLIYTGFLGGIEQPVLLSSYIDLHPEATVVVDPVLGDNGALYPCYDQAFVRQMRKLAEKSHIITPNLTEFFLLTGYSPDTAPAAPPDDESLFALAASLTASRLKTIVITGTHYGRNFGNVVLDLQSGVATHLPARHTGISYSGTGDLFASILCGCIARGISIPQSVKIGADFLSDIAVSVPQDADPRCGLPYEPHLYRLSPYFLTGDVCNEQSKKHL